MPGGITMGAKPYPPAKNKMMGLNLHCCCHKCKEQIFVFRNDSSRHIADFYTKHIACILSHPQNVETAIDGLGERLWMRDEQYKEVGYLHE